MSHGSAYHACSVKNSKDCEYVVKVQSNNATAKRELDAYMRLRGSSVVPKMHAAWLCRGRMYIVLDRMFECKVSKKELKDVLNRFLRLGWLHVDVHPGNVMCNKKGNICLIDLGWAVHKDDQTIQRSDSTNQSQVIASIVRGRISNVPCVVFKL